MANSTINPDIRTVFDTKEESSIIEDMIVQETAYRTGLAESFIDCINMVYPELTIAELCLKAEYFNDNEVAQEEMLEQQRIIYNEVYANQEFENMKYYEMG